MRFSTFGMALGLGVLTVSYQTAIADTDYTARRRIEKLENDVRDLTDRLEFLTKTIKEDGKEIKFPKTQCTVGIFLDYYRGTGGFSSRLQYHHAKTPIQSFVGVSDFRSGAQDAAMSKCEDANRARRKDDPDAIGNCREVYEALPNGSTGSNCKYLE